MVGALTRAMTLAAVAVVLTALAPLAFAGRPFVTEDAGIIAPGRCEVESFAAYAASRDDPAERGVSLQVACGIGVNTQLALQGEYYGSEGTHRTMGSFNGKTALRPLTDMETGVAVAYALRGTGLPDSSFRHEESNIVLVVSVPLERTVVHANLGVVRTQSDGRTAGAYALLVERLGESGLDFGVEAFGEFNKAPWVGTGVRYAVKPETFFIDASARVQTDSARTRQFTLGVKYAF